MTMLSCCEVARLVSESQHRKLTLKEKSSLWLHFAMCPPCKDYQLCVEKVDGVSSSKCLTEEQIEHFLKQQYPDDCLTPECRKKFEACIQQELAKKAAKSGGCDDAHNHPHSH